jgi:hypothetical protein
MPALVNQIKKQKKKKPVPSPNRAKIWAAIAGEAIPTPCAVAAAGGAQSATVWMLVVSEMLATAWRTSTAPPPLLLVGDARRHHRGSLDPHPSPPAARRLGSGHRVHHSLRERERG